MGGVAGGVVVKNVVDVNRVDLRERVPVMRVCKDVVEPGIALADRFGVRAELLVGRVRVDGILHRDVGATHGVNVVPRSELKGDMIQNHVAGLIKAETIVTGARRVAAGPDADMTADDVGGIGEGNFAALETNAAARRGLAGDGDVSLHTHCRIQRDVTPDIKNNDATRGADGVAE